MRLKYLTAIILSGFIVLQSCQTTDNFSKNLLDEEKLATTTVEAIDSKKDEFLEKLREEIELASIEITNNVNENVSQQLMDRVDKTVEDSLHKLDKSLMGSVKELTAEIDKAGEALNAKHSEFLGRLPWYGLYLVLLIWGASIIDDLFRWIIGKRKKKVK